MKNIEREWRLGKLADVVVSLPAVRDDEDTVKFYGGDVVAESISSDADRHLISAAPELLYAVEELLKYASDDEVHDPDVFEKAGRAVAKAKGEDGL